MDRRRRASRRSSRVAVALGLAIAFGLAPDVRGSPTTDVESAPTDEREGDAEDDRIDALERDNAELRRRVERLEEDQAWTEGRLADTARKAARLQGYLDVGFFAVQDTGAGARADRGHRLFPELAGRIPDRWVFVGDPLSTAVNARGEPADTGDSRAVRFDSVDSRGKPSFILNAINLGLNVNAPGGVSVHGLVDFVPRGRAASNPADFFLGDFVDIKLAHLRWVTPVRRFGLELEGGKVDSVFGREYRRQETPDRIEVTPSLMCRYTCGRALGIRARASFANDVVNVAASLTNGSNFRESFGFYDEVDRNAVKTGTMRVGFAFSSSPRVEVGASGQLGAQDLQADDGVYQWQHGVDLHLRWRGLDATAEVLRGRAHGRTGEGSDVRCDIAPCLRVITAYTTIGYRVRNWVMPFARIDWRDADHLAGAEFVYFSQLVRFTPGLRFEVGTNLAIKAQYTVNLEVDRVPQIPNDVFTSSVAAHF